MRKIISQVLALAVLGCALGTGAALTPAPRPVSVFSTFSEKAEAGDPRSQNVLGFMLFFGELAPHDPLLASRWFESAAASGNVVAQLNLSLMHYLGAGVPMDRDRAATYFRMAEDNASYSEVARLYFNTLPELVALSCRPPETTEPEGETAFGKFCAGCHGFNGIAAYGEAPSFAFGERLDKSDAELLYSVRNGHNVMPSWDDKIPRATLEAALRFAMTLKDGFRSGLLHPIRTPGPYYYLFGPMENRSGVQTTDRTSGVSLDELCRKNIQVDARHP